MVIMVLVRTVTVMLAIETSGAHWVASVVEATHAHSGAQRIEFVQAALVSITQAGKRLRLSCRSHWLYKYNKKSASYKNYKFWKAKGFI